MKIALGQMDVRAGRPAENWRQAEQWARQSAAQGAQLALFPELWLSGFDLSHAADYARAWETADRARYAALAQETGLYLAGSVIARDDQGRPTNTAVLFSPHGDLVATYRKVHLFAPMGETRFLAAGVATPSFELPWGRTALAVCYDLRFPELFRRYADAGVTLVLLTAQWPIPRIEHWRILLRARAIENQCVIAACNRAGVDEEGTVFGGHSAVIDPRGQVLVEADTKPDLLLVDVDLEEVARVRRELPVLEDRRPALDHCSE
jgi:predicted amidohydrolase